MNISNNYNSNNIDKVDDTFENFKELIPSFEEMPNPISSYIEKNDNKKDKIILQNPEKLLEEINQNFSNAETNDSNKFTKKKRKISNNTRSNRTNKNKGNDNKNYLTNNFPRNIKNIIFKIIMKFYNKKIYDAYNGNIHIGINSKELKALNKEKLKSKNELLNKTIKDIFSEDISTKFSNYSASHNKELINYLLNEEDKEKREKFIKLFNKTLKDCIIHLRGHQKIEGLEGLEKDFIDYVNKKMQDLDESEDAKKYKNKFIEVIGKIENYFNNNKKVK